MIPPKQIAIYGAGGFAREVAWLLLAHENYGFNEIVGHIEDGADGTRELNGLPVFSLEHVRSEYPSALVSVAVGDPSLRRKLVEKAEKAGFGFATLTHHSIEMSSFNTIGTGSIICCGSILTVNIAIEEQVHINLDCTIGHDVKIGAFSTLSPGVHVSGNVHIGKNVYIGTGANIINGTADSPLVIGNGCVIGAGACVTSHTEKNALYAGVPATLKKRYE